MARPSNQSLLSEGTNSRRSFAWRRSHEGKQTILTDTRDRPIPEALRDIERWQCKLSADVALLKSIVEHGFDTICETLFQPEDCDRVAPAPFMQRLTASGAHQDHIRYTVGEFANPGSCETLQPQSPNRLLDDAASVDITKAFNTPPVTPIPSETRETRGLSMITNCLSEETVTRVIPRGWPGTVATRFECAKDRDSFRSEICMVIQESTRGRLPAECGNMRRRRKSTIISMTGMANATCRAVCCRMYDPHAKLIMFADRGRAIVLMHDLIVTPILVSWAMTFSGPLLSMAWLAAMYWVLDIVLRFKTRIFRSGELITSQRLVAIAYCKSWLLTDLLLLCADWIYVAGTTAGRGDLDGHINSMLFWNMILILLRLLRFVRVLHTTNIVFRDTGLFQQIVIVGLTVLLLGHVMATLWFAMGNYSDNAVSFRWVDLSADPSDTITFRQAPVARQYIAALHFATASLTLVGDSGVDATNPGERLFCIMLLVSGLLGCSTIVSMFSAEVVQVMLNRRDQTTKVLSLCTFLQQNQIKPKLALRVMHQARHYTTEQGTLSELDVPAIHSLSISLRRDLLRSMRVPRLLSLPLFNLWAELDMSAVHRMCDEVVGFVCLRCEDDLFVAGSDGNLAYCIMKGAMSYNQYCEEVFVVHDLEISVQEGTWLCEMALWSIWIHVGRAQATKDCQVISIDAEAFSAFVSRTPSVRTVTSEYGVNYYMRIVSAIPPTGNYPTDIKVPFTEVGDLMPETVSIGLLRRAVKQQRIHLNDMQQRDLEEELEGGKCVLRLCEDGTFERTVSVVAVRVLLANGRSFMQIARIKATKEVSCAIQLPGTKRARGELPRTAFERVLNGELSEFNREFMQFDPAEHAIERKESPQFGMLTEYMLTTHVVNMEDQHLPYTMDTVQPKPASDFAEPSICDLTSRTVYAYSNRDTLKLYVFLTKKETSTISSRAARPALVAWISSLDLGRFPLTAGAINQVIV